MTLGPQTRELAQLMQRKHRLKPLYVTARLPREAAGMGTRWAEAWLMRALLRLAPTQIDNVLAMGESLVEASGVFGEETAWFGQTVVALTAWDTDTVIPLLENSQGIFGPLLPEHAPGVFRTMRVRLDLPAETFGEAPGRLAAFLRDAYAPVTLSGSRGVQRLQEPARLQRRRCSSRESSRHHRQGHGRSS